MIYSYHNSSSFFVLLLLFLLLLLLLEHHRNHHRANIYKKEKKTLRKSRCFCYCSRIDAIPLVLSWSFSFSCSARLVLVLLLLLGNKRPSSLSLIFVFVFFKCYTRNRRAKTAQNRILQNSRVVVYVVVVVVVRTVYMCESTEREQHKRRAFGENVVLICCYSSKCDVTEKKRYAKNIIHSFERESTVFCVFLFELFLPKRRSVLGCLSPSSENILSERERTKREFQFGCFFRRLFLPLKPHFSPTNTQNLQYTHLLSTEREYLFFNNIFFS